MATDYRDIGPVYKGYAFTLLMLMFTLASVDRSILSILMEPIKREYQLSDTQVGTLMGLAFAIPLSLVIVPIGILADRMNRIRLIAFLMALWSAMTALTGLAQSYMMLILARAGLGAAEAGAAPTLTSLASDVIGKERRGMAMGFLYLSSPLGVAIGLLVGGYVAGHFHWRTAFFVVGAPGIILAIIAALTLRNPTREKAEITARDADHAGPSSIGAIIKLIRARRVLLFLLLGGAFCIGAQAACSSFMAPFLIRVHGLRVDQAGPLLAMTYGLGGMLAMPIGGFITDRIRARRPGRELGFFGRVNMLVALVAAAAFLVPDWRLSIGLIALYAIGAHLYYAVTFSSFVTETPPHLRGGATSTMFVAMNLFGYGLAPQFAGIVSDLANAFGFVHPLRFALVCSGMLFLFGGLFLILAERALLRDRAAAA